jgi:hypothetical protein
MSIAIGDANNDGKNEIVAVLPFASSNQVRMYENKSGGWIPTMIASPGKASVVAIGDADNDGKNEIVVGLNPALIPGGTSSNNLRMYKNASGQWKEVIVSSTPNSVFDVGIGDANNDNIKEIVASMGTATGGLKMYSSRWEY